MSQWERQKEEIKSYNVFFSAITGTNDISGLTDYGVHLVDPFLTISDSQNDVEVEPDFTLINGETLLLVEIKAGQNIDHHAQMERYEQLGLEAAENFLSNTDRTTATEVEQIESCIVYKEDVLDWCRNDEPSCREDLEDLEDIVPVLSQKAGSKLKIAGDTSFEDDQLNELFRDGINLPSIPRREIFLSDSLEKESIAVSICHDIAINNLIGRFAVTPIEVRNFYGRRQNLTLDRIRRTLDYLDHVDACSYEEDSDEYVFTEHHEDEILGIESHVKDERVEEALCGIDQNQRTLSDIEG